MSVSESFAEHVLDLVRRLGPVEARRMFGGRGLYLGGLMFGLLDDDELFLKSDELNRDDFERAGCRAWVYESKDGPMKMSYYRPPDGAFDDEEEMLPWARRGFEAAQRAKAKKDAKAAGRLAKIKAAAKRKTPARPPAATKAKKAKTAKPSRRKPLRR